jgi:hypothetical protein
VPVFSISRPAVLPRLALVELLRVVLHGYKKDDAAVTRRRPGSGGNTERKYYEVLQLLRHHFVLHFSTKQM